MSNRHLYLITIVLTTFSSFIAVPKSVSGAERRISGLSCVQVDPGETGGTAPLISDPAHYINGAIRGAPGGFAGVKIQCPVPDDDTFPKSAVRILNIRGRTTGTVTGRACSRTLDNFLTCTDFVSRSPAPARDFGLIMDNVTLLPAWGPEHVNNFGFVEVTFELSPFFVPSLFRINRDENFISGIFLSSVGDGCGSFRALCLCHFTS
jgi:hypothetical protein